ncbi:GFA family protein [Paucibacter sp. B51]|uniref:GFA family protein n=1 Tax=Paucibacter sp. B51 TaxID=2993315 RepID=UPI0022EBC1C3|nr:GFA family protein [Paucibacter sp. B51]
MNPMKEPTIWRTACYCGAASLSCSAAPRGFMHCHCGQCRRLSGGAFSSWLSLPGEAVQIQGQAALREFAPTVNGRRFFCGHCGSHLYTLDARMPEIVGVPAGAVLGPEVGGPAVDQWPSANGHYFCSDGAPWVALPGDGLPRRGGTDGMSLIPD